MTRLLCRVLLSGLLAVGLVAGVAWESAAQKPPEPKQKKAPQAEDDEPEVTTTRFFGSRPIDLRREAELAKHPAVKSLYSRLAVPHEEITMKGTGAIREVEPLPKYLPGAPKFEGKLSTRWLDSKLRPVIDLSARELERVDHYEALAIAHVDQFFDKVKNNADLPRLEALDVAEKALREVLRFHETAKERGPRRGDEWNTIEKDLRGKLMHVRVAHLQALAEAKDWTGAGQLAGQLLEIYPNQRDVRGAVIKMHVQKLELDLTDENKSFVEVRRGLEKLERLFPGGQEEPAVKKLGERLQERARLLRNQVKELSKKGKKNDAVTLLRTVEGIWPQLGGLDELRHELQPYTPLRVGVRNLPENLSPATALTDAETQALELLFESLVRPVADPAVGQRYEGVLAVGDPRLVTLGRQFQMARDARWYRAPRPGQDQAASEPVTAADIAATVTGQKELNRSSEWQDLLLGAQDRGDPFHVRLSLKQGYLDPLALMTFKVVPAKYLAGGADDATFAHSPVGSGPFCYLGTRDGDPRLGKIAAFQANPTYASRAGKDGLPHLREIHFHRPKAPIVEFRDGLLHVLLDVPTAQIKELKGPEAGLANVSVHTLPSRRVYFLAVNHRNEKLRNDNLRRAIAHAIDREKILDDSFRDNLKVHKALNSPYPAGSWAVDTSRPADPYRADMAKLFAKQANAPGQELELLYPNDQPQVEEACKAIKKQVESATGFKINLRGVSTPELHRAVAVDHKYDLAYYHWDHVGDSFWLWPLFDPHTAGRGGKNILGPLHDADLEGLFTQALKHREFSKVQELTRQIHRRLYDRMPVIPLWQLDAHIAIHTDVKPVPEASQLDPLRVFTHIEQWRLAR